MIRRSVGLHSRKFNTHIEPVRQNVSIALLGYLMLQYDIVPSRRTTRPSDRYKPACQALKMFTRKCHRHWYLALLRTLSSTCNIPRSFINAFPSSFLPCPFGPLPQNESICAKRSGYCLLRLWVSRTGLASTRSLCPVFSKRRCKYRCCLNLASRTSSITAMLTSNQSRRWRR